MALAPLPAAPPRPAGLDAAGPARPGAGHDVEALIEDYLAGHSAPTAACYRRDLAHLRRHLSARGLEPLGVGRADLARWVRDQEGAGLPATSVRRRLPAVCGFYSFLEEEGVLAPSPAEGLRRPRGGPAPRLGLEAGDLARLLAVARAEGEPAELLVGLCTFHGLRVGEACAATDADLVCHGDRRALVVRRKGGRRELIGLLDPVADLAERLVVAQGPGPLLRGREGGALHRQVAWRWVRRPAKSAGITGDVFPHLLRHSYVSQALLAGVPLPVVAAGAGHRDLRTTLGYAQALAALGAEPAGSVWARVAAHT